MNTISRLADLDRRAVHHSVELVRQAGPGDFDRATPCAGWTLADLLAHMTAQHRGFAAAAAGDGADPARWAVTPVGVEEYVEAADRVVSAFAADGVAERSFALPEISATLRFPASRAIGFHFIDYVVHSWDVARSLELPVSLPADLVDAARPIAFAVPNGPERLVPGAAFQPARPDQPGASASALDEILARLGRSPAWPA